MNTGKEFINEAYRALFQKDYQRAIELFKKAIALDENNASYYYKLSVTFARNNNLDEALDSIQHAVQLKPECNLYKQHFDMVKGRQLGIKALKLAEQGGNEEEAISLLESALTLDPLNIPVRVMLSWLLVKNRRLKEANTAIQDLLILDPTNKEGIELLKRCNKLQKN
jgi:Flp pilus assembly protein TadD